MAELAPVERAHAQSTARIGKAFHPLIQNTKKYKEHRTHSNYFREMLEEVMLFLSTKSDTANRSSISGSRRNLAAHRVRRCDVVEQATREGEGMLGKGYIECSGGSGSRGRIPVWHGRNVGDLGIASCDSCGDSKGVGEGAPRD